MRDHDSHTPESPTPRPVDRFPGFEGIDIAILRRYVTGHASPDERRLVDAWAAEASDRRDYLAALIRIRGDTPADTATLEAWKRVAARMDRPATEPGRRYVPVWEIPAVRVDARSRQRARILAGAFQTRRRGSRLVAAAALVLAAAGWTMALLRERGATPPPSAAMREIATARGQRADIRLGDGTRVVLGVDSKLRIAPDFGVRGRELYLEGTAYFDVEHDATRPFVVRTANAVTEDIGTRFVVSAYPATGATRVVVTDGSVALGASDARHTRRAILTRGELGRLATGDPAPAVRAVDPALYTAWMRGELVFRDTPLADVVAELARWYDTRITIGDADIGDIPLTASFEAGSLQHVLDVITTVLPVRATRARGHVTLYHRSTEPVHVRRNDPPQSTRSTP